MQTLLLASNRRAAPRPSQSPRSPPPVSLFPVLVTRPRGPTTERTWWATTWESRSPSRVPTEGSISETWTSSSLPTLSSMSSSPVAPYMQVRPGTFVARPALGDDLGNVLVTESVIGDFDSDGDLALAMNEFITGFAQIFFGSHCPADDQSTARAPSSETRPVLGTDPSLTRSGSRGGMNARRVGLPRLRKSSPIRTGEDTLTLRSRAPCLGRKWI